MHRTTSNIVHTFPKRGATLYFVKSKIAKKVTYESIENTLNYLLGKNESSCIGLEPYKYYPNYSEYEIKERLRLFVVAIMQTKTQQKLINYINKKETIIYAGVPAKLTPNVNEKTNKELVNSILTNDIKNSVEKLYFFIKADKKKKGRAPSLPEEIFDCIFDLFD